MRYAVREGRYRVYGRTPPAPPPEWPAWKQRSLYTSIDAAYLFLVKDQSADQILKKMGRPELTKARLSQWLARGCQFFLDREYVRRVSKP